VQNGALPVSIDRDPAVVEALFRKAGAPWPPRGHLVFGSIYSTAYVLEALRPWMRSFFTGATTGGEELVDGPGSPDDPWPAGTNIAVPHTWPNDVVVARVGLLFRSTDPGGVPKTIERHSRFRFWTEHRDNRAAGLPRYLPAGTRFGAELDCLLPQEPKPSGLALQVQVLLDSVIITP
jgi:hypothetical protein